MEDKKKVGVWSSGKYKSKIGRIATKEYQLWRNMIARAYSEKYHDHRPTYKNVEVCDEWLYADVFLDWCEEQVGYKLDGYQLEKDILIKGNKLYSPDTCLFVPCEINNQFVKHNSARGDFPLGVKWHKVHKRFEARITKDCVSVFIGSFDNEVDAFNAYKEEKEKHIKILADKYKDVIDPRCYKAMYNYEVEITD